MTTSDEIKNQVREFWNADACGERYAVGPDLQSRLSEQARVKYELEPYIHSFARFAEGRGRSVLEIGVGMGADHFQWAAGAPSHLAGVDLTPKAISMTRARLALKGYTSDLRVADAEQLPFDDGTFDIVYSWGVLHHTPDTAAAIREVKRVLRPGGRARIMLYHKYGYVFLLLWLRYSLLAGHPTRSINDVLYHQAESVGTTAFSVGEAKRLFAAFSDVNINLQISHGDLLIGDVGARHRGLALTMAKRLWPRRLIRRGPSKLGSYLLIDATA